MTYYFTDWKVFISLKSKISLLGEFHLRIPTCDTWSENCLSICFMLRQRWIWKGSFHNKLLRIFPYGKWSSLDVMEEVDLTCIVVMFLKSWVVREKEISITYLFTQILVLLKHQKKKNGHFRVQKLFCDEN